MNRVGMKKRISIAFCVIILTLVDFAGSYIIGFFREKMIREDAYYQSVVQVNMLYSLITIIALTFILLLLSALLSGFIQVRSIAVAGFITGCISGIITLLFGFSVSWGWKSGAAIVHVMPSVLKAFLTGFLFPVLYRWFNKEHLFNEHFY